MKQRSKVAKREVSPAAGSVSATELGELRRQGAKSAARGEAPCVNPMDQHSNLPEVTGECATVWEQRRDAWHGGHAFQTKIISATSSARTSNPRTEKPRASTVREAGPTASNNEIASTTDIAAGERQLQELHRDIAQAQETLSDLRLAIEEARTDECLQALFETGQENERLHAALHEQGLRAAQHADSANAALLDAVRLSETDQLTQLPNRVVLWDRLGHDLALAKRRSAPLAVLYLDLDGFKEINDRLGHDIGDLVLKHVARILVETMRTSDTVCRVGGDEFVIVAIDIPQTELAAVADKISHAVAVPVDADGHEVVPSVSIGTASYPDDGDRPEALVRVADMAMYEAKRRRHQFG